MKILMITCVLFASLNANANTGQDLTLIAVDEKNQPVFKPVDWQVTLPDGTNKTSDKHTFVIQNSPKGEYTICLNSKCRKKNVNYGGKIAIQTP